jgi:co-chaperonin GroES (HSP10)
MIEDRVLIEKNTKLDGIYSGSIVIPDQVNLNDRESKIGKIVAVGPGYIDGKGRTRLPGIRVGRSCYYTRYGKEVIDLGDDCVWIITRQHGVLAYVEFDADGFPCKIEPRLDRILIRECIDAEKITSGGIVIPNPKKPVIDYRLYEVLEVGPGLPQWETDEVSDVTRLDPTGVVIPLAVSVGDFVWAAPQCGVQISWNHRGSREEFILAKLSECIMVEKR